MVLNGEDIVFLSSSNLGAAFDLANSANLPSRAWGCWLKVCVRLPPLAVGGCGLAAHTAALEAAAAARQPDLGQALGQAPAIKAALAHRAHHRGEGAGRLAVTLLAEQGLALGLQEPHHDQLVDAVFLGTRGDEAHREQTLNLLVELHQLAGALGRSGQVTAAAAGAALPGTEAPIPTRRPPVRDRRLGGPGRAGGRQGRGLGGEGDQGQAGDAGSQRGPGAGGKPGGAGG